MKWYRLDKRYSLIYVKLFFLSLLYVFPLILADIYYNDDLGNAQYGVPGWSGDGRPLAEAISVLLSGRRSSVIDLAPLPLILSMLILVYALVLYAKTNWDKEFNDYMQIMVLLFVLVNPFNMANLSYRYGCIVMFAALSIPFFMYSIPETISKVGIAASSVAFGVIIMCIYQPAICMCLVLCVINLFLFVIGKKKKIMAELYRLPGIGVGAIGYKCVIAPYYVSTSDWRQAASQIVGLGELGIFFSNIVRTCNYIINNILGIPPVNLAVLGALIAFAMLSAVIYFYRDNIQKKFIYKFCGIIFVVASPVLTFFATFFPLLFLEQAALRSRVYLSVGGFLLFIGIMILYSAPKHKILGGLLCAMCIFYQYTFMYSYANALKSQNEYQKYMVYNIAHDLETINSDGDFSTITVIGTMPKARQTQLICNKYPLINELVPIYIDNDTWIGGVWLYRYLQDGLTLEETDDLDLQVINTDEPIMQNSVYSCYTRGEKIIIYFRDT